MRLDKFLSHVGLGSRKEVKEVLKKEVVEVNQKRVKDGKFNVNEVSDVVTLNGEALSYQAFFYYMLHKPQGVISATEDGQHRTVLDLLAKVDYRTDIFPVGRLDKDTTGLLILTNDGPFSHNLLSPKKHIPKTYLAEVEGVMTSEDVAQFAKGIMLRGDEWCQPAELAILHTDSEKNHSTIRLTISEGKYHQVKRMVAAVGKHVLNLHRETMGPLSLDEHLKAGDYRPLAPEEIAHLQGK